MCYDIDTRKNRQEMKKMELSNIRFSTDNIKATKKQKDFICTLIDNLDYSTKMFEKYEHYYDDVENMSRFDAMTLIKELKLIQPTDEDYFDIGYEYDTWNCGDR